MPKTYGDERILATSVPGPLIDRMKATSKARRMRMREGVVEALELWLAATILLDVEDETRRELRARRVEGGGQ